ncbi:MAG: NAD(P)-dependent oxidoreductase [Acidimicrobiia bacterium]
MANPKIAVLGLGIMGNGIATNYLKSGYEVYVWNRSKDKCLNVEALGATTVDSPKAVCENADIIFDVTANDESSKSIFFDEGILARATQNQVLITCATLSIDYVNELSSACEEKGLTFFDMPMTGSRIGAESGNLTLLVGGEETKLSDLRQHLEPIAGDVRYFGKAGNGMKFKLILNAIQAAHVIAFGQAMKQAKTVGLDLNTTAEFIAEKPGGYPTQMSSKAYFEPPSQTQFSVKWILKDLKYAKEMLNENNFSESSLNVSILDASINVLQDAYDRGLGDLDWTVVNQ